MSSSTCTLVDMSSSNGSNQFGEWLEARLRELGWSKRELASRMEMSEASIYSWTAPTDAEHHRQIQPRSADQLARALGVHANEVREAAGLQKRYSGPQYQPRQQQEGLAAARVTLVPVIGLAPANSLRYGAVVGEMIPVPAKSIQHIARPQAVVISGDCLLSRGIHDGDYLMIEGDTDNVSPQDGNIVVVRIGDEITTKEWWQVGDRVLLRPTEPGHEVIEYTPEMDGDFEVIGIGRVVMNVREV